MRMRILIPCIVVLAILFAFIIEMRKHQQIGPPLTKGVTNEVVPSPQSPIVAQSPQPNSPAPKPSPPPVAPVSAVTTPASNGINPAIQALLQKPINFYGKVLDENSNAVANASVRFQWDDLTADNWTRTLTTQSDSDGLFSLRDRLGSTLTVSVSKDGYYTPKSGQDAFKYAVVNVPFSPDSQNPVIFFLRKKGVGVSLIEKTFPPGIRIAQLHHDGTPVNLDLLNGTQVPAGSGQLQLQFWRDISDRNAAVFDWKLQLSAPGGGLISTDEEFPFQAPQTGYQPSIVIDMPATNQNWIGELQTKYYIQLPNGNYGRFNLYLLPRNGVFSVNSAVNPSGSQNLEPAN